MKMQPNISKTRRYKNISQQGQVMLLKLITIFTILAAGSFTIAEYLQATIGVFHIVTLFGTILFSSLVFILLKREYLNASIHIFMTGVFVAVTLTSILGNPGAYVETQFMVLPVLGVFFYNKYGVQIIVFSASAFLFYLPAYGLHLYPLNYFPDYQSFFVMLALFLFAAFAKNIITKNERLLKKAFEDIEAQKQNELELTRLKVVRAQMNPHFIFNALNSIQDVVLQEKPLVAYDTLVKFSELMRSSLFLSATNKTTLEEELKFLTNYVAIENLRLDNTLHFSIKNNVSKSIVIPSQIIQPFIENSIVHGLANSEGVKKLTLAITELSSELKIVIEDNGIGLQAAKKQKTTQTEKHLNFSLSAVKHRLQILSNQHGQVFTFNYTDLKDKENDMNTRLTLHVPFE